MIDLTLFEVHYSAKIVRFNLIKSLICKVSNLKIAHHNSKKIYAYLTFMLFLFKNNNYHGLNEGIEYILYILIEFKNCLKLMLQLN